MLTAVGTETGMDFSQDLDGYWMKTDDYANKPLLLRNWREESLPF